VSGDDGSPRLAGVLPESMEEETWEARTDWFVDVFRATGYLRSGPYHPWPCRREWPDERQPQQDRARELLSKAREKRAPAFRSALAQGEMIPESDEAEVHPLAAFYMYPSVRHTFGAIAVGLAGGAAGPVPIQAHNGGANPDLPEDACLEAPTRIEGGQIAPQTVPVLPEWMNDQLKLLARQRMLLAGWLATGDADRLKQGLMLWPRVAPTDVLLKLSEELPFELERVL
jgi:alpha-galactosidase/6-phospho-beta-glucosidase family protein